MTARSGRSYTLAAFAAALVAIAGCGGSSSPNRSKHAVFVPPGLGTAPAGSSSGDQPGTGSTSGSSTTSPAGAANTPGGAPPPATDGLTVAKITFAAPGGESRTTFVQSAYAICRSFRARARAIGAGATTLGAQETELSRLVAATEQSVKALTELSPPEGQAPGLRRFATMTVASVLAFAEAQSRTRSTSETVGAQVEAQDLADSGRSSRDAATAAAAARALGLHVCGSPGAAWL